MAVEFKDYYKILGIPRNARDEEIKRAFRKLARQYHPDVAKDKKRAEEKFKEINEAYEVLSHSENRKRYDELGAHWRDGGAFRPPPGWRAHAGRGSRTGRSGEFEFRFGGTGFSDFFEQFFGRQGGWGGFAEFAGQRQPRGPSSFDPAADPERGRDIQGDLLVTLAEALHGSVRSIAVRRTPTHGGPTETHTYKVRVPPGVREGQRIRLTGKGDPSQSGGIAGDLYLRVRFAAHPDFRVKDADLHYELELAPWEAVLGTTVSIPALEGNVTLRIPPGTNHGQQLRLRERGLPSGASGARGNLYVTVALRIPSSLDAETKALWEELARKSDFNPRQKD